MFQVLAHTNLPHQPILVTIHAGQLANVGKDVLQAVGELEGVHVAETVLIRHYQNQED